MNATSEKHKRKKGMMAGAENNQNHQNTNQNNMMYKSISSIKEDNSEYLRESNQNTTHYKIEGDATMERRYMTPS